jgi:hypothetical protein
MVVNRLSSLKTFGQAGILNGRAKNAGQSISPDDGVVLPGECPHTPIVLFYFSVRMADKCHSMLPERAVFLKYFKRNVFTNRYF